MSYNVKKLYKHSVFCVLCLIQVSGYAQSPCTLKKSLQNALTLNLSLKKEFFNIDKAETDLVTAQLRPNPLLNNQTLQLTDGKYFPQNTSWNNALNRQVWWQLTKVSQLPNQRSYKIEVAEKQLLLSKLTYKETERKLLFEVANKWLNAFNAERSIASIKKSKAIIDTLVKLNKIRFQNQIISQTDVLRAEIVATEYDLQLGIARVEALNRLRELKLIMGLSTKDSLRVDVTDTVGFNPNIPLDSLAGYALRNRADIQEAREEINIDASNVKLQRVLAIPQPTLGMIWNPQNTIPYLGFYGTIEIPLFNRNQGQILKSGAKYSQSLQRLVALQLLINTQVSTAYAKVALNRQNKMKYSSMLLEADAVLESVKYSYLQGGTSIADFLEAQKSRLLIQREYGILLKEYWKNYLDLLYYTGLINELAKE